MPEEVIVVADRCTDLTSQTLERWEKASHEYETNVITKQTDEGPGRTRNLGLTMAKCEAVAFIDDDCVPESRWLHHLTQRLDPDTGVVGVGGRVLPMRNDLISRYNTFCRILEPPASLEYLVSANCCYLQREALRVGGFDEDIIRPGGEDVGLSLKLREEGCTFRFANDATVWHDYRNNLGDFIRTFANYGRGCHRMANRHSHYDYPVRPNQGLQTRGGYGYFGGGHVKPWRLIQEIIFDANVIRRTPVFAHEKIAFMGLKILQRISYHYGWDTA